MTGWAAGLGSYLTAAVLGASLLASSGPPSPTLGDLGKDARTWLDDQAVNVVGNWSGNQSARSGSAGRRVATNIEWEEQFVDACAVDDGPLQPVACDFRFGIRAPSCAEGETPRAPRWTRSRVLPAGEWSEWQLQDYGTCVGPGGVIPVLTAEEFRRLPLPAPVLNVQPDADRVFVNVETIVYTDPTPVTLRAHVLGVPVTVEATPWRFTYDWGDGHSTTTHDPGRPYPAFDVVHRYEATGDAAVTLTTEWTGRYQVAGDAQWREVAGTAATSTTSREFEVQERRARLVPGTCVEEPDAPGCEGFDPRDVRR